MKVDIKRLNYIMDFQKKYLYYPDTFVKIIAKQLYLGNIRLDHPLMLTWDLMNSCNLTCSFCSAGTSQYKGKDINLADWKKTIAFIKGCRPIYLTLRGGEPSIHPYFKDILVELKSFDGFLEIVTNGTGITPEVVKVLSELPEDKLRVKISLDSSDEKINDQNRSVGSYYLALRAIENLSTAKIKNIRVQAVATEKTIDGIFKLYEFLHNFNVNSFGVSYCTPSGDGKDMKMEMFSDELLGELEKCIKLFEAKKQIRIEKCHLGYWQNVTDSIESIGGSIDVEQRFKIKCGVARWKLNVDANGDIYPCDFLKYPLFKLGTIEDEFNNIWNSKVLLQLYDVKRKDKRECSDCNNLLCTTGCMGLAYEKYGDLLRRDPNCKSDL